MKRILFAAVFLAVFVSAGQAQNTKPISADAGSFDRIVRGAPFSADGIIESIQVLADGTRLTRSSTRKLFRDREGRLRREEGKLQLGIPGSSVEVPGSIEITDPVARLRYSINVDRRTVRQFEFKLEKEFKVAMKHEVAWDAKEREQSVKQAEKRAELSAERAERAGERAKRSAEDLRKGLSKPAQSGTQDEKLASASSSSSSSVELNEPKAPKPPPPGPGAPKVPPVSNVESLGTRSIEGVEAIGTRTTTTIRAGTIGNDRDFEVYYEKWYSPELQMIVLSKNTDPRFGEQSYRLTNISRENPPITLFSPPADFRTTDSNTREAKPAKPIAKGTPAKGQH